MFYFKGRELCEKIKGTLNKDEEKKAHPIGVPFLERMMGIEPTRSAWKAEVLPLNYIRISVTKYIILRFLCIVKR